MAVDGIDVVGVFPGVLAVQQRDADESCARCVLSRLWAIAMVSVYVGMVWYGSTYLGWEWYGVVWCGLGWYGLAQLILGRNGMVWVELKWLGEQGQRTGMGVDGVGVRDSGDLEEVVENVHRDRFALLVWPVLTRKVIGTSVLPLSRSLRRCAAGMVSRLDASELPSHIRLRTYFSYHS